jgi:hypothetical protein
MRVFKLSLIQIAAPRLLEFGYRWDEKLRDCNLTFGFSKQLGPGVEAQIIFQRHQHQERPDGLRFTVGLHRRLVADADSASRNGETIGLEMRLPAVMWFVYGLRATPFSDYGWNPLNEGHLVLASATR